MSDFILRLADERATLQTVGGKGMSLAKLSRAGLPVPDGFHITTEAYRQFVAANDLQGRILATLSDTEFTAPASLEAAAARIAQLFAEAEIPDDLASAIVAAYTGLGDRRAGTAAGHAVAVRSSATAEDLPEASFAGQQESYLNVCGTEAVLAAVRRCWASLWTARAIAYRARQGTPPEALHLAVVVQVLVPADASGMMFTANPVTGSREEIIINATWGLGEAIVSGAVTPDSFTVAKSTLKIIRRETAEKGVMTVRDAAGTHQAPVPGSLRGRPVLGAQPVKTLARFGVSIEHLYGMPMDIEWALAKGKFAIVQARPITALPTPAAEDRSAIKWAPPNPKGTYMRTSIADLMPAPLSPLFITWGLPTMRRQMQPLGARMTGAEPILEKDYITSINGYAYMNAAFSPKSWWWILTALIPSYPRLLRQLTKIWREELRPEYQAAVAIHHGKPLESMPARELWKDAQAILDAAMYYACGLMFATMGASAGSEGLLTQTYNRMVKRDGDPEATALLMGWNNIGVRADKSLYDIAMWARQHEELAHYLQDRPAADLAGQLAASGRRSLPAIHAKEVRDWPEFEVRFKTHLQTFGHLAFQWDFAEALPLERPEVLLETLKMYLRGEGPNPHRRQQASEARRVQTTETTLKRLRGLKRWLFLKALRWGQSLAEVREDALADMGLGYPALRARLGELGARFVQAGAIRQAADIYWLEQNEVATSVGRLEDGTPLTDVSARVEERKAFNHRAGQEVPPPMMPMKERVMGLKTEVFIAQREEAQTSNVLKGVPTSAGRITAPARVLRGQEDFHKMQPGSVLVAMATSPAWTPLFAMASAVVTDIGGPLSHGSIVAREYGIPAVMGTGVATRRIQDGQVITVDGSKGEVVLKGPEAQGVEPPASTLEWPLPHPKAMLARGSLAEFVPEPVSPLFATLAVPIARDATLRLMGEMGATEQNAYLIEVLNDYVYVGFVFTPRMIGRLIYATVFLFKKFVSSARIRAEAAREHCLAVADKWKRRDLEALAPSELLQGAAEIFGTTAEYYTVAQSGSIPAAQISEIVFGWFYNLLVKRKGDPPVSKFVFGSENHAVRSEKALFDLATWAKSQPQLEAYLRRTSADAIVAALETESDRNAIPGLGDFAERLDLYLQKYGHAIYDLDFAKPVPAEAPAPLLETLKVYLTGKNDPYQRQRVAIEVRDQAAASIGRRLDPLRRRYFSKLLQWAQDAAPLRENSIAEMGLGYPQLRRMLGELGRRLAAGGAIVESEDIYWLEQQEVASLAGQLENGEPLKNLAVEVESRRKKWQAMRLISPPNTLPKVGWISRFFPSNEEATASLKGFGASAGRITAQACVMLGPEDFNKMQTGNIIVAGITTPAWTPLFARAAGIVTDIGGLLSHSSIVAREYGIPAVLATGVGTRRIKDGQTITVDGNAGMVTLEPV